MPATTATAKPAQAHAPADYAFPWHPHAYAPAPAPSLQEWRDLWRVWDLVSRRMIPESQLLSKPIHLRNVCLFYLGHIPAFLDKQVTRGAAGDGASSSSAVAATVAGAVAAPTEPAHFETLFERGIDPDVDNPALCHAHSEIPDEWPPLEQILAYQRNVRARVEALYLANGVRNQSRRMKRALWLGFEHEAMHLETLLYMLLQSDWVLPPPGPPPDFAAMAAAAAAAASPITSTPWISIPARVITQGMHDPENDEGPDRYFGWDNEKPARETSVAAFETRPFAITNGEYARYLEEMGIRRWPKAWKVQGCGVENGAGNGQTNGSANGTNTQTNGTTTNGSTSNGTHTHETSASTPSPTTSPTTSFLHGKAIRTVYGSVPLQYALDWPVMGSYDELSAYARWAGGRIPTAEEAQSIYAYVEELDVKAKRAISFMSAQNIPAVNGHLSNNGVEETPPPDTASLRADDPQHFFSNLEKCNVGFRAFHTISQSMLNASKTISHPSATAPLTRPAGRGEMGGVWEWTSTPLSQHEGFAPMDSYPAYTADFFDGKHNIVLGGSWATHPRIAGRKSFVNWYQRNYPYAWCGARVVRDVVAE